MDGPTECQSGQLDGLWRLSVSLTATGDLDLRYTESPLSRGTGGDVCVYNGQARLSADGRGMHCAVLSFLTITLPRVDVVCFITAEKLWGITYHTQASIMWAMKLLLSLTKGSNFILSQKESPILDHNLVKTALCKEVSKSVSFLAQWDKICNSPLWITLTVLWEKHKVNLHCHQIWRLSFQARREVTLKPRSISDVSLPEVTYHGTGIGHFSG